MSRTISDLSVGSLIYIDEIYDGEITHVPYIYLGIDENGNARVLRQYTLSEGGTLNNTNISCYAGCQIDSMLEDRSNGFLSRFNMATYNALADTLIKYSDYTDSNDGGGIISQVRRKCFLLSYSELGYGDSAAGNEGKSYIEALATFYDTSDTNYARITKKEENNIVTAWTRSAFGIVDSACQFYFVNTDGSSKTRYAEASGTVFYRPALSFIATTPISDEGSNEIFLLPGDNSNTVKVVGTVRIEADFIERTISEYVDMQQTMIGSAAFAECSNLKIVSCPSVTSIKPNAFASCISLQAIDFPNVESLGHQTFMYCSNILKVKFSKISSIGSTTFNRCSKLREALLPEVLTINNTAFAACYMLSNIVAPKVTTIGSWAFQWCSSLQSIDFPNLTSLGGSAFDRCAQLSEIFLSKVEIINAATFSQCNSLQRCGFESVTSIGSYAFDICTNLSSVSIPLATTIYTGAFRFCSALQQIEVPYAELIGSLAFSYCTHLETVIIGLSASSVCTLAHSNAFTGTSSLSYIYVPSSLVESYKTATNWTYFSSIIYGA